MIFCPFLSGKFKFCEFNLSQGEKSMSNEPLRMTKEVGGEGKGREGGTMTTRKRHWR